MSLTRVELGRLLTALREQAGMTQRETARRLAGTPHAVVQSTLARWESSARGGHWPPLDRLVPLLDLYGPSDEDRARIVDTYTSRPPEHRRVEVRRPGAVSAQREWLEVERTATEIRAFQPTGIPGLLQTEGYARAVAGAELDGARLEEWLSERRRQTRLLDDEHRRVTHVVSFGALLWGLGGAAVMREQLAWMVEVSRRSWCPIGVVPETATVDRYVLAGFTVYRGGARDSVIVGTEGGTAIYSDARDVDLHLELFDDVSRLAVWGDEARAVLTSAADRYR